MNNEHIVHLPVYEPAGRDVFLDVRTHLLIVGATGCGKTTLLTRIIRQFISQPDTSLLILDAKQDDTVAQVKRLALEYQRPCVVLGPQGTHYVDLFQPLRSLADVDAMVKRLLVGSNDMGPTNAFWNEMRESLLDALLTMLVEEQVPVTFDSATTLMGDWFFRPPPRDRVTRIVGKIQCSLAGRAPAEKRKLNQTLDTVSLWANLEGRTRSNVQATLVNALRPLMNMSASRCFESNGRPSFDVSELEARTGICVVSTNATTDTVASLFFKILTQDFISAVQRRRDNEGCLCGIFADEITLLATECLVDSMSTIRSRKTFICGATQNLALLDNKLGVRQRKAMLANCGTVILMRNREEETDLFASTHLGTTERWVNRPQDRNDGFLISREPMKVLRRDLVCPAGTLGRLEPHQGFIVAPCNLRCESPLWFVPHFEETATAAPMVPPQLVDPASGERLHRQLRDLGFKRRMDSTQLEAALKLFSNRTDRAQALEAATEFFTTKAVMLPKGLSELPLPWLKALPMILWSLRQPHWTHIPYFICEVFATDGLLQLRFAQEAWRDPDDREVGAFDRVRLAVNARLYPSCYRPLKRQHTWPLKPAAFELEP